LIPFGDKVSSFLIQKLSLTCKNIQCTQNFSRTHTGEEFIIYCNANCKTENIIYLLESERIMVARRSEMSAEWKVRFAICIASVAIQAFTNEKVISSLDSYFVGLLQSY
jgi:hypothetical protein